MSVCSAAGPEPDSAASNAASADTPSGLCLIFCAIKPDLLEALVNEDAAARALLDEVVAEWIEGGVLGDLSDLVRTVWRCNVDRYEPARLGDDALSLGVQSSRNVCSLAVRKLAGVPDVLARDVRTLENLLSGARAAHQQSGVSFAHMERVVGGLVGQ